MPGWSGTVRHAAKPNPGIFRPNHRGLGMGEASGMSRQRVVLALDKALARFRAAMAEDIEGTVMAERG